MPKALDADNDEIEYIIDSGTAYSFSDYQNKTWFYRQFLEINNVQLRGLWDQNHIKRTNQIYAYKFI